MIIMKNYLRVVLMGKKGRIPFHVPISTINGATIGAFHLFVPFNHFSDRKTM